ncbi:cuticle protein 16.5-like [Zerene cesonia]|uniref:cuticle protein 16.5-like n=1 Tax=Zerene cesonia TaxID=33412 RepID=UPI0018E56457|nr:cuticle protein 16.5-like [Zerene cesonia]
MFKFIVVCAFIAVAAASPDLLIRPQLTYSTGIAPAVTTYSTASGYINTAPVVYSSPVAYSNYGYTHLIKKRSPGFLAPVATSYSSFGAPLVSTYSAPFATYGAAPIATYGAPLVHSAPVYSTAHLIKKRSAPLIAAPASFIAPASYSAPLVSTYSSYPSYSSYPAATIVSTPYISSGPYAYTQFIKK